MKRNFKRKNSRAYSLAEMLIAVTLFAFLVSISAGMLVAGFVRQGNYLVSAFMERKCERASVELSYYLQTASDYQIYPYGPVDVATNPSLGPYNTPSSSGNFVEITD